MFSSSGQGQTSYVPSEGISCKELAASGNEHLLKPGGENRHGDGVDDKEEEEDAIIKNQVISRPHILHHLRRPWGKVLLVTSLIFSSLAKYQQLTNSF